VTTVLRAQIVAYGKIIFDKRSEERQVAFWLAYKEYALLNEERASILGKYGYSRGGDFEPRNFHKQKVTILRYIRRIQEEYANDEQNLENCTKQDAIVLNLQRACEASIDLAMHIVAEKELGIPQSSRDAFDLLRQH